MAPVSKADSSRGKARLTDVILGRTRVRNRRRNRFDCRSRMAHRSGREAEVGRLAQWAYPAALATKLAAWGTLLNAVLEVPGQRPHELFFEFINLPDAKRVLCP